MGMWKWLPLFFVAWCCLGPGLVHAELLVGKVVPANVKEQVPQVFRDLLIAPGAKGLWTKPDLPENPIYQHIQAHPQLWAADPYHTARKLNRPHNYSFLFFKTNHHPRQIYSFYRNYLVEKSRKQELSGSASLVSFDSELSQQKGKNKTSLPAIFYRIQLSAQNSTCNIVTMRPSNSEETITYLFFQ